MGSENRIDSISQSARAISAYDAKAQHFDELDPREQYGYMHSKMMADYTLIERVGIENKSVLNIGCSFPIDEIYYARKVYRWTAVDVSERSLDQAKAIVQKELHSDLASKFTFQFGDACDLPFANGCFDLSLSMSTFDHIPTEEGRWKAIEEVSRVTRSGGHVIITVPNRWCIPYAAGIRKMTREETLHYGFVYLFSPQEIRRMGMRFGLKPISFASSTGPPHVWLRGYPKYVRYPAVAIFQLWDWSGIFGRRIGFAFLKL